jgi:hypothetical protein
MAFFNSKVWSIAGTLFIASDKALTTSNCFGGPKSIMLPAVINDPRHSHLL